MSTTKYLSVIGTLLLVITAFTTPIAHAISLNKAVNQAIAGEFPKSTKLHGHDFVLRSLKNKKKLKPGETGYFRHEHIGKDDRVFFSIKVRRKNSYTAKITRIEYRGVLNTRPTVFGVDVTRAASLHPQGAAMARILQSLRKLHPQKILDGNWEPEAAVIVDTIGRRMAADAR